MATDPVMVWLDRAAPDVGALRASLIRLVLNQQDFAESLRRHWAAEPTLAGLVAPESGPRLVRLLALLAQARADPRRFARMCRRLARAWRRCGAGPSHFDAGGAVLLHCLAESLGEVFVDDEERWAELYGEAAEAMLAAFPDASTAG